MYEKCAINVRFLQEMSEKCLISYTNVRKMQEMCEKCAKNVQFLSKYGHLGYLARCKAVKMACFPLHIRLKAVPIAFGPLASGTNACDSISAACM